MRVARSSKLQREGEEKKDPPQRKHIYVCLIFWHQNYTKSCIDAVVFHCYTLFRITLLCSGSVQLVLWTSNQIHCASNIWCTVFTDSNSQCRCSIETKTKSCGPEVHMPHPNACSPEVQNRKNRKKTRIQACICTEGLQVFAFAFSSFFCVLCCSATVSQSLSLLVPHFLSTFSVALKTRTQTTVIFHCRPTKT